MKLTPLASGLSWLIAGGVSSLAGAGLRLAFQEVGAKLLAKPGPAAIARSPLLPWLLFSLSGHQIVRASPTKGPERCVPVLP